MRKGDYIKDSSVVGHKAAGVPGTVAGMAYALEKYGTMKWADVCEPARKLAADGFTVSYHLENSIKSASDKLALFPESKRIYLRNGKPYEEGEIFIQPELAATFERMIKNGSREFYEGETAQHDRRQHDEKCRRLDDVGGFEKLSGQRTRTAACDVSRQRNHHDAAAVFGRDCAD